MLDAGDYNMPFVWGQYTVAADSTYGGKAQPTYTNGGTLWGQLKTESASRVTEYESQQRKGVAEIRLTQWPAVSALDRLTDAWGIVWILDGVRIDRDGNETICTAHQYEGNISP